MPLLFLPDPGQWATTPVVENPVTPRDTLNASASTAAEQQLTLAAENAPLRVIYGQVRLGPLVSNVLAYNGALVILAVWGHGEVDSFVDLQIDDKALASGVTYTHYTGTAGQTVNSTLVAAFAAQSPAVTYTDALPGICYSVVVVPAGSSAGFPRLNATIKGRKVYDPRSNYVTNSAAQAGWTQYVEGTGAVSISTVTDPIYGSVTRITKTAGATGDRVGLVRSLSGLSGSNYTTSVTVKSNVAGTAGYASYCDAAQTPSGLVSITRAVPSSVGVWERVPVSVAGSLAGTATFYCPLISGPVNSSVDVIMPQLELSAVAGGYIAAGASATVAVTAWSDNPAICAGDFAANTTYGMGKAVDQASVGNVAADCDALAGGGVR